MCRSHTSDLNALLQALHQQRDEGRDGEGTLGDHRALSHVVPTGFKDGRSVIQSEGGSQRVVSPFWA